MLRLRFQAREPIHFAPGTAANFLRGGFGKVLYRGNHPAYEKYFAPASSDGPSGLRDLPRPFVFRVAELEGARIPTGAHFEVRVNLFEKSEELIAMTAEALSSILPARLEGAAERESLWLSLEPGEPARRVRVKFLTATEIKGADRPQFGPLFARIRDRISTLRALYGPGPLEIDFAAMGERARQVRMTCCEVQHIDAERLSRHTGQRHPLGGFVGLAEYEGDLTEFTPYLEAARYTGVGRQTVWGKGQIAWETF